MLLHKQYQDLTRKNLRGLFDRLFADFTGLHFQMAWAPSLPHQWTPVTLPTGYAVCRQLARAQNGKGEYCRTCGPKHLAKTLRADGQGHQFNCRLGVRNYWLAVQVRGVMVGIAYLQALAKPPTLSRHRQPGCGGTKVLSRSAFDRASRLLHLIVEHVQMRDLAELRKADLTNAGHAVIALEREQVRLREALQRHLPLIPPVTRSPQPESHPNRLVRGLMDYIEQAYAKPITLQACAARFGMNPAYLSDLFSRALGVPFKTYLTEWRLQKARELLGEPSRNVSDVARAVGYASDNRFRIAFKKATGLAPSTWRETFRAAGHLLLPWIVSEVDLVDGLEALLLG